MQEVTSISQLNEYAKGQLVELPSFGEDLDALTRLFPNGHPLTIRCN